MAHSFNGSSNYLTLGDDAALTLSAPWSVAGWFRIAADSANQYLFSWGTYEAYPSFTLRLWGTGQGWYPGLLLIMCRNSDSAYTYKYTSIVSGTSEWQHIAITMAADSALSVYIDGDDAAYAGASTGTVATIDVADDLYFGTTPPGNYYWFDGGLAEWAKWDRALEADEITALAAGASPEFFMLGRAWYLPMKADLRERDAGLDVTNNGSVLSEHPVVADSTRPRLVKPLVRQLVGG